MIVIRSISYRVCQHKVCNFEQSKYLPYAKVGGSDQTILNGLEASGVYRRLVVSVYGRLREYKEKFCVLNKHCPRK